jgi:radical SAM protein (TIGR04043 family)/putative N-acetyltransferase (TIGR04045 family)
MRSVITMLQSCGIRVPEHIQGRNGGAGPAEGRAFLIDGVPVNVPIRAAYTAESPFSLADTEEEGCYTLLKSGLPVTDIRVVPPPHFYLQSDHSGIPFQKIALLHGRDCLATTVLQTCVNWGNDLQCAFCATRISLDGGSTIARKTPSQLAQVARLAAERDGVTHLVLTSGTGNPPGSEITYLAECTRTIKAGIDLPVHVQFLPPMDLSLLKRLKAAGVDTVGIHIESFDLATLHRMAPVKARIGFDRYETAWKRAVEIFGANQVSSFLIVGLGEPPESILWGSELLADLGVYPFVVPLRPIPGSRLEAHRPPDPALMERIYTAVARILRSKGLSAANSLAGCVRCGACSALAFYEKPGPDFIYRSARTAAERSEAFAIRHSVFVEEQGLFADSDRDEHDETGIHLVARHQDRMVGTVRLFPDPFRGNGSWIGGRLAVHPDYRVFRVGACLVKEAMKRAKKKGCTVFTAHVQEKNVRFFQKLGWRPIGPPETICDHPHQQMQADLSRVPDEIWREL